MVNKVSHMKISTHMRARSPAISPSDTIKYFKNLNTERRIPTICGLNNSSTYCKSGQHTHAQSYVLWHAVNEYQLVYSSRQ